MALHRSFLRHRLRTQTALSPHPGNHHYLIPKRVALFKQPVMGVVAAQSDVQSLPIAPVDMKPFLVSGVDIVWSATGLPTGLTISATTGIVSGTAPLAAGFNPTITATNQFGTDTSAAFVWTITI